MKVLVLLLVCQVFAQEPTLLSSFDVWESQLTDFINDPGDKFAREGAISALQGLFAMVKETQSMQSQVKAFGKTMPGKSTALQSKTNDGMSGVLLSTGAKVHTNSGSIGENSDGSFEVSGYAQSVLNGDVIITGDLSAANVETTCPNGMEQVTGFCIHPETPYAFGLSWDAAHDTCNSDGFRMCSQTEIRSALYRGVLRQYDFVGEGNKWYMTASQAEANPGESGSTRCDVQGNTNEENHPPYSMQCQHAQSGTYSFQTLVCCSGLVEACPHGTVLFAGTCIQPVSTRMNDLSWVESLSHCHENDLRLCSQTEVVTAINAGVLREYPWTLGDVWYTTASQAETTPGASGHDQSCEDLSHLCGGSNLCCGSQVCDVQGNLDQPDGHVRLSVQCNHEKTTQSWRAAICCGGIIRCPPGLVAVGGFCIQPVTQYPFGQSWYQALESCEADGLRLCSQTEVTTSSYAGVLRQYHYSERDAWYHTSTLNEHGLGETGQGFNCDVQGNIDQPNHPQFSVQCQHGVSGTQAYRTTICCY